MNNVQINQSVLTDSWNR